MPEGPELFLSSLFINRVCDGVIFSGKVARNPIHKCPDINWDMPSYTISSESRGKELKLHLRKCSTGGKNSKTPDGDKFLSILFTFGMSGKFEYVSADNLPKHSHLMFFTEDHGHDTKTKMALAFIDYRRFGKWVEGGDWSDDRGPCVIQEHTQFINHVAANLDNSAFNKPICEVLLNQKFFNGIGNYLRAEILYRCKVAPFEKARSVLELIDSKEDTKLKLERLENNFKVETATIKKELQNGGNRDVHNGSVSSKKVLMEKTPKTSEKEVRVKKEEKVEMLNCNESSTDDIYSSFFTAKGKELMKLCGSVPLEVIEIGSVKSSLSEMYNDDTFHVWLQCYYREGMKQLTDHNSRTIWFSGPAGPMAPKAVEKVKGKRKKKVTKSTSKTHETKQNVTQQDSSETKSQGTDDKSQSKALTRRELRKLKTRITKKEPNCDVSEKAAVKKSSQGRKRETKESTEVFVALKKVKRNEITKGRSTPKRLTRSTMKIES